MILPHFKALSLQLIKKKKIEIVPAFIRICSLVQQPMKTSLSSSSNAFRKSDCNTHLPGNKDLIMSFCSTGLSCSAKDGTAFIHSFMILLHLVIKVIKHLVEMSVHRLPQVGTETRYWSEKHWESLVMSLPLNDIGVFQGKGRRC